MTGDEYVVLILNRYAVPTGSNSPTERNAKVISPYIHQWAGIWLSNISFSGSYAKGTGVLGTTDIDLFISLRSDTPGNSKDLYERLYELASDQYWDPRRQNVSIGITYLRTKIDLTPARIQAGNQNYHSLYVRKKDSWTQTNVSLQIDRVKNSQRVNEIRAVKIWRNLHTLDFPSFYLELMVMDSLYHRPINNLSDNVLYALRYISSNIQSARIIDPSNTNNVISDELSYIEKTLIASQASSSSQEKYWENIIWQNIFMENKLKAIYTSLQAQLTSSLTANRVAITHPGAKGEASEENWLNLFELYLPYRYQAHKAFVIDSNGECSEQIDIVIYDRHFTPLLYNRDRQRYIPAESVYAVFEVKQDLNRAHIEYAGEKAASVRKLFRTSTYIQYAAGEYQPRPLFEIISGILTYESGWTPALGEPLYEVLKQRPINERIDLGCVVMNGGFEVIYKENGVTELQVSESEFALVYFLFRLLDRLQKLGTVPAIDYAIYSQAFNKQVRA